MYKVNQGLTDEPQRLRKPSHRARLNRRQRRTLAELVRQVSNFVIRSIPAGEVCHG